MKISILPYFFVFVLIHSFISGQSTLPNGSLEQWRRSANNRYDEPSDGVWATPNRALDFALPGNIPVAPVQKVDDAQDGQWAVLLHTSQIFGILMPGTLFAGKFNLSVSNPDPVAAIQLGTPFTFRPSSFHGYFKYKPVLGDSCLMYALLTRYNTQTANTDTIGIAEQTITREVAEYEPFDLPFEYRSTDLPDSIRVVFTSSANGNNLKGQPGSRMWVDNVALLAPNGTKKLLMPEAVIHWGPNPASNAISFISDRDLKDVVIRMHSMDGHLVSTRKIPFFRSGVLNLPNLLPGKYCMSIYEGNRLVLTEWIEIL
jgi:hypothetical protein